MLSRALKGKVVVASDVGGRAEVAQLQLVRDKESDPWSVAASEVERTLGLPPRNALHVGTPSSEGVAMQCPPSTTIT